MYKSNLQNFKWTYGCSNVSMRTEIPQVIFRTSDASFLFCFVLFCFCLLGLHLHHMQVPRLGVESEIQLLSYTTTMRDVSHVCGLPHSSQKHQIFNH